MTMTKCSGTNSNLSEHRNGARVTFLTQYTESGVRSLLAPVSSRARASSATGTCKGGQKTGSFFSKYKMGKFELKHLLALLILIAEVKMKQNI